MDFKKVSEIYTVAIPFVVFASCIRLITYYHHWNIPIADYISASELLLLFIWPILTIAGLLLLYAIFNLCFIGGPFLYFKFIKADEEKKEPEDEVRPQSPEPESEAKKSLSAAVAAYIIVGVGVTAIIATFLQGIFVDYDIIPVVILHLVIFFVIVGGIQWLNGSKDVLSAEGFLFAAVLTLLSASFFYGRYEAHYAETNPAAQTVALTDGSTFTTDANIIYLGKTSGFYFYYRTVENESLILPAAQIKSVTIKRPE